MASHDAFVTINGATPLQDAEKFFGGGLAFNFGPSGEKTDMFKAMVQFWIMRTATWKATYSSAKKVEEQWLSKEYDITDTMSFS